MKRENVRRSRLRLRSLRRDGSRQLHSLHRLGPSPTAEWTWLESAIQTLIPWVSRNEWPGYAWQAHRAIRTRYMARAIRLSAFASASAIRVMSSHDAREGGRDASNTPGLRESVRWRFWAGSGVGGSTDQTSFGGPEAGRVVRSSS